MWPGRHPSPTKWKYFCVWFGLKMSIWDHLLFSIKEGYLLPMYLSGKTRWGWEWHLRPILKTTVLWWDYLNTYRIDCQIKDMEKQWIIWMRASFLENLNLLRLLMFIYVAHMINVSLMLKTALRPLSSNLRFQAIASACSASSLPQPCFGHTAWIMDREHRYFLFLFSMLSHLAIGFVETTGSELIIKMPVVDFAYFVIVQKVLVLLKIVVPSSPSNQFWELIVSKVYTGSHSRIRALYCYRMLGNAYAPFSAVKMFGGEKLIQNTNTTKPPININVNVSPLD